MQQQRLDEAISTQAEEQPTLVVSMQGVKDMEVFRDQRYFIQSWVLCIENFITALKSNIFTVVDD